MKTKILNVTKTLIRLKSLSFTMNDIANQLGISKKTLYQYFSGKEEIISSLIMDMKDDMERQQIELFNDQSLPLLEKMRTLLKIQPTDYDLINSITLNQLRKNFYDIYTMVNTIYHNDWTRFDILYKQAVDEQIIKPFDITFMKELYIISISNLPESPNMRDFTQKELVNKTVNLIFNGIGE